MGGMQSRRGAKDLVKVVTAASVDPNYARELGKPRLWLVPAAAMPGRSLPAKIPSTLPLARRVGTDDLAVLSRTH